MEQARFLIVDDHPLVRMGLRTALQAAISSALIAEASSLGEAFPLLVGCSYDAVLLDLTLPDSCGAETYQAIQKQCPETPVVIITGENPRELSQSPQLAGAVAVLSKASGPDAILTALATLVGHKSDEGQVDITRPALTSRERDILILCARGLQNKVIGRSLGISENTVRAHLASVFKRFGLSHRGEVKGLLEQFRIC
ncbi:MAG: hypothetical protein CFE31_08160 [Rhizobiales bacterium PAR1]|nr:MAG: hypothetical protein CFE31_08160 [Rhizobiales bacterium PAR1]